MKEKKVVTVTTLAQKLGVSTATVTKALNGQGRISEATVKRVRDLARELRYVPNLAARSLRTNIKDAVGLLITSDIINPWYSQLTSLLESELSKRGLTMLLALGKGSPERVENALNNFYGGRVRGIIVGPISGTEDAQILRSAIDHQIPLVIFSNLEKLPLNFVALDQAAGARIMLEHLYQLGHRKIAYLGAYQVDEVSPPLRNTRNVEYVDFMEKYDLEPVFLTKGENYGGTRRKAYDLMNHILKTTSVRDLPTAILAHNDDIALGALLAFQQSKIRVPEDISLTGFDDIAESSFSLPGLTTIGGVMESMAENLVSSLENVIQNGDVLQQKFIIPKLIIRETTAEPRKEY